MIKSDREMKNNSIHHRNLLKQIPHLRMSFQDWQFCLKEKNTPLEGFEPQSKPKLQVRCDLHFNH